MNTIDSRILNGYARNNPELAREALEVPPRPELVAYEEGVSIRSNLCDTHNFDLEDYLKWRKWSSRFILNSWTKVLLSHALSFPLTLAAKADHFIPADRIEDQEGQQRPMNIKLCCVGSRAEANLPDEFWQEFLICANLFDFVFRSKGLEHGQEQALRPIRWTIDFIGPDMPSRTMQSHQITLPDESSHGSGLNHEIRHKSLSMNYHSDFLHNHVFNMYKSFGGDHKHSSHNLKSVDDILQNWDGFVLYNPGIGHPNLKDMWKPTMDFILKTNSKILVTAHSALDAQRDLKTLMNGLSTSRRVASQPQLKYELNPFASRIIYEDICHQKNGNSNEMQPHFVRPNHSTSCF